MTDEYELTPEWLLHRRVAGLEDEDLDKEQAALADYLDQGLTWMRAVLQKVRSTPGVSLQVQQKAEAVAVAEARKRFEGQRERVEATPLKERLKLLEGEILAVANLLAPSAGDDEALLAHQEREVARLLREVDPLERVGIVTAAARRTPPDLATLRAAFMAPASFPIIEDADLLASIRETVAESRFPEKYAERRRLQSAIQWREHTWAGAIQHLRRMTGREWPLDVDPIQIQAGLKDSDESAEESSPVADALAAAAMTE